MTYSRIKYYPVGNGDTSLISLYDKTSILIDTNITISSENEDDESKFDVKEDLLVELQKDEEITFTDVFILTHPDQDHIRNFQKNFYIGDPNNIKQKHIDDELIRIDELWFSPKVFDKKEDICEDAEDFKKEAERRMKLHKDNDPDKDKPGNRIVIIGYSDNPTLKGLESLIIVPGNSTSKINNEEKENFSLFIHAPFKDDTDNGEDRNDTSIIFQASFKVRNEERASLAIFGGDAGWRIWEKILSLSDNETVEWDLLLAPHHCSWGFFNDSPEDDNYEPLDSALKMIEKAREGAWVISSSRLFQEETPPNEYAKKEYVNKAGEDKFLLTSEYPNEEEPKPIVFRMTQNGPQKEPIKKGKSNNEGLGASGTINRYGKII